MRAKRNVVVVDLGASFCRVGFAGDDEPRSVFPSLTGTVKPAQPGERIEGPTVRFGANVRATCEPASVRCLFKDGFVQNKDDYSALFGHIFETELRVDPEKRPIVLSEPIQPSASSRRLVTEILYETFRVPSIYLGSAPSLALFNTCKTEGLAVDIGESFSQVAAIYEWTQMPQTLMRTDLAGNAVTKFLLKVLKETSYHFSSASGLSLAQDVKESECFIALDFDEKMKEDTAPVSHQIAEDTSISIGKERFSCPELLFQPKLNNLECYGLADLMYESVMRADTGMRENLLDNIVITGGSTMFIGFKERLTKELQAMFPKASINMCVGPRGSNSVWVGGSILGSLELFEQMVVTREEYHESGGEAVRRRFY